MTTAFQAALLAWTESNRRDLPWRRSRHPWAVLVSEMMLAQTQAGRVVPHFEAFMQRWPDPARCAAASPGEVIAAWNGLGYNRRALFLHQAAAIIVDRHGGEVPDEVDDLLALPGVGPYTARAVLAFAFDRRVGVVDTNAARVLARAVAGQRLTGSEVQRLADLVVAGGGWTWNQAMLDLGATVCTARGPACSTCPLGPGATDPPVCGWACRGGPDPAIRSAGVSRPQSRFAGSDRQGRGRLMAHLSAGAGVGALEPGDVPAAAGWPGDPVRAAAVADGLVREGLLVRTPDGALALP
jgi:A/G-specific adenine glycosylase